MIQIDITSNLHKFKKDWVRAVGKAKKAHEDFFIIERPRLEKHVQLKARTSVYGTPFRPTTYKRTYNFLKSLRVYFPVPSDKTTLYINSDITIAKAIRDSGGYARFIAGQGVGIGFLKTEYYNAHTGKTRKSYFPREWDKAIIDGKSPYYNGLERGLSERYYKHVIKKLEKFT